MFIDTNVFVNSRIPDAPGHKVARQRLTRALLTDEPLRISRQILREYLSVVTRPQSWSGAITRDEALEDVDNLIATFEILEDSPMVTASLVALIREVPIGGSQVHDANIVATMLAHGERRLLTLNARDFRRYGDRIVLVGDYQNLEWFRGVS